ncbi:MAG TPA: ABC transporter ATP-binding protein [Spirochaetota bacterium]
MNSILEVRNLVKQYPSVRAVDGVSFSIKPGICFGLLGPNGAGKTTTIEMIEGITRPTAGEIFYKGSPRTAAFRAEAGVQLQNTELPQFLSVRETLELYRNLYPHRAPLNRLIEMCRLEEIISRDNGKISGGQRQRLLLAIALANDPELVFLDEPTTGLDPQARRHLWEIIGEIRGKGKTVILTTHYMEEAELLCDIIAIMDHGKIIAMGSPRDLLNEHSKGAAIILPRSADGEAITHLGIKWYPVEDTIEIQTDSLNETIGKLVAQGIDLSRMTVRSQNIEDLFLKLTGSELRS